MKSLRKSLAAFGQDPEELAKRSGVSIEDINDILNGRTPTIGELQRISRGLRVPLARFAAASHDDELSLLFRRSIPQEQAGVSSLDWIKDYAEAAISILPTIKNVPSWLDPTVNEKFLDDAEALAYRVRQLLGYSDAFSPATDLCKVVGAMPGIVVGVLNQSKFEGVSFFYKSYFFIFISSRFKARMLFTLAHELGHVVAHHLTFGAGKFETAKQIGRAKQGDKIERFADEFASNLLMPQRGFAIALSEVRKINRIVEEQVGDVEIGILSRMFGVSFEAAAYRCERLQLLPSGGAAALTSSLRKAYGSPEKRAESLGLPARIEPLFPRICENLARSVFSALNDGRVSVGWTADKFNIAVSSLINLHAEYTREVRH